ncbi:triacylglycerol lipase 2-like [Arachis stenosperma]|uniref:triacylglycerol lipase 2-like n=1 Tax=Arachis stenosperma TaxID=217475 RepID=UPI0025AB68EE|nr:triacylglycerol lipase 2-like [Arachis stenosperma]
MKMAPMGLFGYPAMALCVIVVLAFVPSQAHGSLGVKNLNDGFCATFITPHGYKCEEHEVTTKDGYILSLQRIPQGRTNVGNGGAKRAPVIVQHGVMVGGMSWVLSPPSESLPMILANSGFDVWISNARGTVYSQKHISLNSADPAYWDWTWDEMVANDVPALFDYVYTKTHQKIHYVGHSLGTLVALVSFSERDPVVMERIKSAALLSPIAYLNHMTTQLVNVAARTFIGEMTAVSGRPEFDPNGITVLNNVKSLCITHQINCDDMLTAIAGENCCMNSSVVERFLDHIQPTATKNLIHLSQSVRFGTISKFNYELPELNLKNYGSLFPPRYDLTNIPVDLPIFMSYGGTDALSDVVDVQKLLDTMSNHDADKLSVQYINNYAHADFVMGYNAKEIVYDHVIAFFNKYQ